MAISSAGSIDDTLGERSSKWDKIIQKQTNASYFNAPMMFPFYYDYMWRGGKPSGKGRVDEPISGQMVYRIVADPYRKWISVEAYWGKEFDRIIYDSRFLDFRKLTPTDQAAWRKESINSNDSWIFNEDDRLILKECCHYKDGICREIQIFSPYSTLVCRYVMPEGPEGSVVLYDSNERAVMRREGGKWDMNTVHAPEKAAAHD